MTIPERLDGDADRRLAELDRLAHAPIPKRSVVLPLTIVVAGIGLGVWGWLNATTRPNGATLLGLLAAAALVTVAAKTVRGYWVLEQRDRKYTEDQLNSVQQNRSTEHYLDGA